MAHYSEEGKEPLRQADSEYASPQNHALSHRISNISEISDFESNPYDAPVPSRPLQARESLVSLDSRHHGSPDPNNEQYEDGAFRYPPSQGWAGSLGYSSSGSYAPVGASFSARALSKMSRKTGRGMGSTRRPAPETIEEAGEEYDLSLISKAAPIDGSEFVRDQEEDEIPNFDLSSGLGPMNAQDEEFVRMLQQQEAQGTLTGGIGQGVRPDMRVRHEELLSSPVAERSLSRSFTRRMPSKRLSRGGTLKDIGQDEANRRGEVIEVIVEEPAGADLSNMEGPANIASDEARRSTFATTKSAGATQIFYPQPNWKPFSMRWPWLLMLISLSFGLAAMEEILFQKYNKDNPLLRFKSADDVEPGIYFMVKFGPTIIAVVYGVLWQFTDFEVRRLEAYFQMSKPGGALAAESINVDYVTSFSFFRPFRALKVGHYAVALSSAATTFAVSLIPTFAAASLILTPGRDERKENPDAEKDIQFSPIWSRLLMSTLFLNAILGCTLFYLLQTRRTGLIADVRGIAGLASMAVVSHILMDFKDLDTAKPKDIHHKLKYYRYLLRNSSLTPDDENPASNKDREKYEGTHLSENPHPAMLRPAGSIPFIIALILFMGFIPAFLFTPADVVTDKVPWLITAMAVGLKLSWNSLETAVRMMEPYYILSKRHAHSKVLTLDYTALPFGYMPIRALFNGHGLMFLLGFGTVMAEFLTILVTGLATVDGREFMLNDYMEHHDDDDFAEPGTSGQETVLSFYVSLALSFFILLYMCTVSTIVFIRRRHPFLPRQPNTIASVLAFIHQSKMVYNFVGTTKMNSSEMAKRLDDGTTYGLGWFAGRDGQVHCGVDQEELMNGYKHGVDASQGNQPWNMRWDVL